MLVAPCISHYPLLNPFPLDDVQKRYSVFYLIGCLASALSGILAFGFMQMAGLQDLAGWRWIFIMEGLVRFIISFSLAIIFNI